MIGFHCVGNWKMNKNSEQAAEYVRQLKSEAASVVRDQSRLILLPPALIAWQMAESLKGTQFLWGGQNCYAEAQGAFTGENSPQVLYEMGARFCLVGHSERRQIFAEPEEMLAKKVQGVQQHGLTPIFCVGETMDDRRWSRTQEVIVRQLRAGLKLADTKKPLWLAYEPVWAIGTGVVAEPLQVEEAHGILRKSLREWNAEATERIPILYGGSVNSNNARTLTMLKNVDGFLIGGASLDVNEFLKIHKVAEEMRG